MKIIKHERFEKWYRKLDLTQKTEVDVRITRILFDSHFGKVRNLGTISELKLKKSGLRIYYGFDGQSIVLLISGGSKNNKREQSRDIQLFKKLFQEYLDEKI